MKTFLLTITLCLLFFSCWNEKDSHESLKPIGTKISGKIQNIENDSLISIFYFDLGLAQISKSVKVDENGCFTTNIVLTYPQNVQIWYKQQFSTILFPGDSLFVALDEKNSDFITLSGDPLVEKINTEMLNYRRFMQKYYWRIYSDLMNKETLLIPNDFKKLALSYRAELIDSIHSFCNLNNASKEFKDYAIAEIDYKIGEFILEAPYRYCSKQKVEIDSVINQQYFHYPDSIFNTLDKVNDVIFASSNGFFENYIGSLLNDKKFYPLLVEGNYIAVFDSVLYQVGQLKNKDLSTLLTSRLFVKTYGDGGFEITKELYPKYKANIANEYYRNQVDSIVSDAADILKNRGAIKDKDKFIELNKNPQMSDMVNSILQTDKKYIYIDVWATWCGPCKKEFEFAENLHKQIGNNVKFVYLCISSNEKEWRNTREKYQLAGEHYILDEVQSKLLRDALSINGIPHYILLNNKGEVLDMNMTRPSDPKTIEKLR